MGHDDMELIDLHAWAMRHLEDPELAEVAVAVLACVRRQADSDYLMGLVRDMARESVATQAWWQAYHRFRTSSINLLKKGD